MKNKLKLILNLLLIAGSCLLTGVLTFNFSIKDGNSEIKTNIELTSDYKIELAEKQIETIIETEEGEIEVLTAPTVERVENNQVKCEEGEECGQGQYIYAPVNTPWEFKDYTLGNCYNTDGYYGAQCWDLGDLFWQNYAGRNLSTCGTGGAKGAWLCKEQNAGDNFDLITDTHALQAGDWIIFNGGQYGHVGMSLGSYNNGYIALLGQNQGGAACNGGGQATNIINISLKDFAGAFRPKSYKKPDPTPTPTPIPLTGCTEWNVVEGDTMSGIMLTCEHTVVYGEAMDNYAKTWYSRYYRPNQSVYDGWKSESGVGLYNGDTIDHKVNE